MIKRDISPLPHLGPKVTVLNESGSIGQRTMTSFRRVFTGNSSSQSSPRRGMQMPSDDTDPNDDRRMAFSFIQPSQHSLESIEKSRERSKALASLATSKNSLKSGPQHSPGQDTFDFDFIDENPSPHHLSQSTGPSGRRTQPVQSDSLNPFHPLNMKKRLDSQQFYSPRSEVSSHSSKLSVSSNLSLPPRQAGMSTLPSSSAMRASNTSSAVPNNTRSAAMSRRLSRRTDSSSGMSDSESDVQPQISPATNRPPRPQTSSSPTFKQEYSGQMSVSSSQQTRYPPKPISPSSGHAKTGNKKDDAFFFDAFGLDPNEIDNQVTTALEEIAGSNPDLSLFFHFNDDQAGDASVSSGFTNASPSPSPSAQSSPRMSPAISGHKKSSSFWDDESDASSFAMSVSSDNGSREDFWAANNSTTQVQVKPKQAQVYGVSTNASTKPAAMTIPSPVSSNTSIKPSAMTIPSPLSSNTSVKPSAMTIPSPVSSNTSVKPAAMTIPSPLSSNTSVKPSAMTIPSPVSSNTSIKPAAMTIPSPKSMDARSRFDSKKLPDTVPQSFPTNETSGRPKRVMDLSLNNSISLETDASKYERSRSRNSQSDSVLSIGRTQASHVSQDPKSESMFRAASSIQTVTISNNNNYDDDKKTMERKTETLPVTHHKRAVVNNTTRSDTDYSEVDRKQDGRHDFTQPSATGKIPNGSSALYEKGPKMDVQSSFTHTDRARDERAKYSPTISNQLTPGNSKYNRHVEGKLLSTGEGSLSAYNTAAFQERNYVRPTERLVETQREVSSNPTLLKQKQPSVSGKDGSFKTSTNSISSHDGERETATRQTMSFDEKSTDTFHGVNQSRNESRHDRRIELHNVSSFESGYENDNPSPHNHSSTLLEGPIVHDIPSRVVSKIETKPNDSINFEQVSLKSSLSPTYHHFPIQKAVPKFEMEDVTAVSHSRSQIKTTNVESIDGHVQETDNQIFQPKSSDVVEFKTMNKSEASASVQGMLSQRLQSPSYSQNEDQMNPDAHSSAPSDRPDLSVVENKEPSSWNRIQEREETRTNTFSKTESEASAVTDKSYKNISAALSNRVMSNPQITVETTEPPTTEEKKGILSSLLSRRKANEDAPKESKGHFFSSKKNEKSNNPSTNETNQLALKDDPLYQKYFKMLKIGMPMDVVKHALLRDGLDPSVMDGDPDKPATATDEGKGIPLKDDPRFAKYFKMLKMGLPLGAVKNAMIRDGEDPDVLDGDHNAPAKTKNQNNHIDPSAPKEKDMFRRARVHWDSKGKVSSSSVWAIVKQDLDVDSILIDDNEFEALFQAEIGSIGKTDQGSRGKESSSKKNNAVKVIDSKRANNGGIVLARLKMSYDELATAVDSIDDSVLSSEQVQGIVGYIPTKEERTALRNYITSFGKNSAEAFENLCECEKFMVAMMTVRHSKEKMRALQFKLQFNQCLQYLVNDMNLIERACEELAGSVRFRKLLGVVLSLGNKLNTAGRKSKGMVGSFTIQSLLKLHQTKAFDNKTTFLQYVILVVERNDGELSGFKEDLPSVIKAEKIFWDQCMADLDEVESQLHNIRKMALLEVKMKKRAPWAKLKKEEDENLSDSSLTLEEEVAALRSTKIGVFALDAMKKVSSLMTKVEATKTTFEKLLEYFGEEENKGLQPHSLFEIIVSFMKNYDTARQELLRQGKLKKKTDPRQSKEKTGNKPQSPKATVHSNREQNDNSSSRDSENVSSGPVSRRNMNNQMSDVKISPLCNSKTTEEIETYDEEAIKKTITTSPSPLPQPTDNSLENEAMRRLAENIKSSSSTMTVTTAPSTFKVPPPLTITAPSSQPEKIPSPPEYYISESKSFEPSTFSPEYRKELDESEEMPFDHNAQLKIPPAKPSGTPVSDRDSESNAQSTLRARRERLARRKLISR